MKNETSPRLVQTLVSSIKHLAGRGGGGGVVIAQTLSNISCLILSPFYAREIATMNKQMLALVRLLNFEILKQSDDLTSFGLVSLCSGQVGRFIFDLLKKGEQLEVDMRVIVVICQLIM